MSGAQTGMNAFAPSCYPTAVRATGVSWMLGIGRFGSISGSFLGGMLLTMGWGFSSVISILAIPATIAAIAIVAATLLPAGLILYGGSAPPRAPELGRHQIGQGAGEPVASTSHETRVCPRPPPSPPATGRLIVCS